MPQHALVADDDLPTCQMIRAILHSADIEAVISTESAKAVEFLQSEKFDVILLDVNMPSPDGIEVTKLVRASAYNQKTPVIIITGEEDTSILSRAFQAGANFFLYKPINKERLLNLTRAAHSAIQSEKRHYQRVVVARNVQVLFGQDIIRGETIDISMNGLLIRADRTFAPGSYVTIRLFIAHGSQPITAEGTVVRLADPHMGIHLENISRDAAKRLQDFLLPLVLAVTVGTDSDG